MSTKIYEGLRLADPAQSLFEAVPAIASAITEVFHAKRRAVVAEQIVQVIDSGAYGDDGHMVFDDARSKWLDEQHQYGHHHALNDPLRFSIVFGRAASGRILALPYYLHSTGYADTLAATGLFQEYGYWNNADRLDDVTDDEWDTRRRDWDSILSADDNLAHLPMWQLPSMQNTFSYDVLFDTKEAVDEFVTARERLTRSLTNALVKSRGEIDRSQVFPAYSADARTARHFVDTLPDDSPIMPTPVGSFAVKYGDIPAPQAVPDEVIQAARKLDDTGPATDTR